MHAVVDFALDGTTFGHYVHVRVYQHTCVIFVYLAISPWQQGSLSNFGLLQKHMGKPHQGVPLPI